jgi:hypothetical protein
MEAGAVPPVAAAATTTGWVPTRKWLAALVTGGLTIVGHAIASGGWDNPEWAEVLTLASALALAYLVPNSPTPGGVPDAT